MTKITQVKKRNGEIVSFDELKIKEALFKALTASGEGDGKLAERLTKKVVDLLQRRFKEGEIPHVEQIQDIVEEVLILENLVKAAKAYILYREQRRRIREAVAVSEEAVERVDQYLGNLDWEVQENANMAFSLQGLNHYVTSYVIKKYWLNKIYPKEIREANQSGDFHIHNLDTLGAYCVGWDLYDLLLKGFGGVQTKIESRPPKHFRVALGQVVNFMYTLQGEAAGAIAFSNFDTLLAPFIRYDNLNYKQVKQAFQEFLFNMAVPTRVGFQCLSEDTQILTPKGWKSWYEVNEGDIIYTFNLKTHELEQKSVKKVFRWFYKGKMYNLKNRNQDQLISPNHRIVRQVFNTETYVLEPIEKVLKYKSPIPVPTPGILANKNPDLEISDRKLKILAWVLSEGSIENKGSYRVSIYQSSSVHPENYKEIKNLLEEEGLEFDVREQTSLGTCQHIRLLPSSSKKIHQLFGQRKKVFPSFLFKLSQRQARLFLETYIKGDGWHEKYRKRIVVTSKENAQALLAIAALAGYNANIRIRKTSGISKKTQYLLTLTQSKHDYIQQIKEIDYQGVIWSVNTDNETVIAQRKGQVFITGNSPFTNITLDLRPSSVFAKQPVIIGGKPQKETYQEFEEEMKIFNKALYEVYLEGDKNGRPFHFPIPTINITKDFPWQEPAFDGIFEASAKYGINYFANYINSEMKPEDVRSMCCRLRLNLTELYNRGGGGLFGSGAKTGSIGVVTINLPRIGYLSKTKKEFFQRLGEIMDLAREALEIKRKAIENLTEKGLYPYSKYWLGDIKKTRGGYWANHFSTIGLVGMNEALLNFLGEDIASKRGRKFALEILDFMRERLVKYQKETGHIYNLEATPAESTAYRLAQKDKERYPDIICAGTKKTPYYTNSTQLPVNYTNDVFEALKLQDELQCKYTGGCIEKGNKVLTDKGLLPIEYIVENFGKLKPLKVVSYNKEKRKSEWDEVVDAVKINVKKHNKIRIIGERGLDITTSDWHPFFVLQRFKPNPTCPICQAKVKNIRSFAAHIRWNPECKEKYQVYPKYVVVEKRADELKPGDYILQNHWALYPNRKTTLNRELAWLIGFYIGDGCISKFVDNRGGNNLVKYKLRFFSEHKEPLQKVAHILNKHFGCNVKVIQNDKRSKVLKEVATSKKEAVEFFFKYGFSPGKKDVKICVPQEVKQNLSLDNVFALLSGLMDSDGHISKKEGDFEYYTVSSKLAEDILEICSLAGVLASIKKKTSVRTNEKSIWRVRIPRYELTRIKQNLENTVGPEKILENLFNRKKRYFPVVRVKKVSKVDVKDEEFYDLTTKKNHNYLAGKNTLVFVHNTVFHIFLGERMPSTESVKVLVKKVFENFHLPYITVTPTFSICPVHGYLAGEHFTCPKCTVKQPCEVYSRIVGYIRPVSQWNEGKKQEFKERKEFKPRVKELIQQKNT